VDGLYLQKHNSRIQDLLVDLIGILSAAVFTGVPPRSALVLVTVCAWILASASLPLALVQMRALAILKMVDTPFVPSGVLLLEFFLSRFLIVNMIQYKKLALKSL
jgi:hypothetical protein